MNPNQPSATFSCHSRIDIRYLATIAVAYHSKGRRIHSRSKLIGDAIRDYGGLLIEAGRVNALPTHEEALVLLKSIGIDASEEWNRSRGSLIKAIQEESFLSEQKDTDTDVSKEDFDKKHAELWGKKGGEGDNPTK